MSIASIPSVSSYAFSSPNTGSEATLERAAALSIASHVPVDRPHVAFVGTSAQAAMATLDQVASVATYKPSVAYPSNGFGQALQAVAGAMAKGAETKVFWVQTGGFDTHASQDTTGDSGAYVKLMTTLNDGVSALYNDLRNQGLLSNTLLLSFSEFGRRAVENGSKGTDHGAASVMLATGGGVRGGLFGTAPSLNPDARTPRSRTTAETCISKPTSDRSTRGSSTTGWGRFGRRARREPSQERNRVRLTRSLSDASGGLPRSRWKVRTTGSRRRTSSAPPRP